MGGSNIDEARVDAFTHTQLTPRPKPPRRFERVESIDEGSQSSPVVPTEDDNGFGIVPSVEHQRRLNYDHARQEQTEEQDDEILFVTEQLNKRRRISPPTSPPAHQPSSPTTPTLPHNSTTHRFLAPPPRTPAPFTPIIPNLTSPPTTTTSNRPTFILPPQPTSPQKPTKPLPEIFSPSRKAYKYVPDGLAATMQAWIIEAANTGHESTGVVWGRGREDGVKLRVRVTHVGTGVGERQESNAGEVECFPGHCAFVKGETDAGMYNASRASSTASDDAYVRVLLAGQGGASGAGSITIRIGCMLGIKQPFWDMDVAGQTWVVGVDWVVL